MPFRIVWHPKTSSDLKKLEKEMRERVIKKVRSTENNPFRFVERLTGYALFKLRIGDYRAVLEISSETKLIKVFLVEHRSKVYQELRRRL